MNPEPKFPLQALLPLIDVLARQAVADHLTPKPAPALAEPAKRPNRVVPKRTGKG